MGGRDVSEATNRATPGQANTWNQTPLRGKDAPALAWKGQDLVREGALSQPVPATQCLSRCPAYNRCLINFTYYFHYSY